MVLEWDVTKEDGLLHKNKERSCLEGIWYDLNHCLVVRPSVRERQQIKFTSQY